MIFEKVEEERNDMILHVNLGILTFKTALSNACFRRSPKPHDLIDLALVLLHIIKSL